MAGHLLGEGCAVHRASRPPRMIEVPHPEAPPDVVAHVDAVRAGLARRGMFNGPIAVPMAADAESITFFRGDYAWYIAERDGLPMPAGRAMVGVALVLVDPAGRVLWQQRAAGVQLPGVWDVSAAGAWHPDEDILEGVYREAREEIGVDPSALAPPDAMWVTAGPPPRGVSLTVRIPVPTDLVVRPDPQEVSGVRWEADPRDLPHPGAWAPRLPGLRMAGIIPA
ncbi:MAG: NUDIX hydrolase [Thermoleophilia bacterium]